MLKGQHSNALKIKCPLCKDSGLPPGAEVYYDRWSIPTAYVRALKPRWQQDGEPADEEEDDVPEAVPCTCEEGIRWAQKQQEAIAEGRAKYQAWRKRQAALCRQRAQVPTRMVDWTLDTYPGDPKLVQIARDYLNGGAAIDDGGKEKAGLLLMGTSGVGKTGLAVAMLNAWTSHAHDGLFWEVGSFLRAIRATFNRDSGTRTEEVTDPARKVDLLVLDDIGDVGRSGNAVSDFTRAEIFDLVNFRYNEQKSTIFTSNLTAKQMAAQFGERVWWRMADMCLVVEVGGKNLRA